MPFPLTNAVSFEKGRSVGERVELLLTKNFFLTASFSKKQNSQLFLFLCFPLLLFLRFALSLSSARQEDPTSDLQAHAAH